MIEKSHTLDWQVSENADGHAVVITPNRAGEADGSHYDFVVVCTLTKHKLMDERARLIAAAPELLSALEDIIDAIGTHDPDWAWEERKNARAAIAKATGESQ